MHHMHRPCGVVGQASSFSLSLSWQAIEADDGNFAVWGNRSLVRLKLGNAEGAATDARRAVTLQPTWAKVCLLLRCFASCSSLSTGGL